MLAFANLSREVVMKTLLSAMLLVLSTVSASASPADAARGPAPSTLACEHHEGEKRPEPAGDEHHEGEKKPEPTGLPN